VFPGAKRLVKRRWRVASGAALSHHPGRVADSGYYLSHRRRLVRANHRVVYSLAARRLTNTYLLLTRNSSLWLDGFNGLPGDPHLFALPAQAEDCPAHRLHG